MAVQPDVEKKGFFKSVATAADDVFTRVTAGIDAGEFRRMLRGEPPGRPNPRLKPHSESFLLHIKPTYYHESVTRFTHTFRLGLLSTYLFLFETITGIFLMIWYTPSPDQAYVDMINILSNVPFGQLMRDLHRLGAELMVVIRHRTYGAYVSNRKLQSATPVHLVHRGDPVGGDALPQFLRLSAAVGSVGVLGRDHRYIDGRSSAAADCG